MEELELIFNPVPHPTSPRSKMRPASPDIDEGRFGVPVDQGDGWTVIVKVLKSDTEGPIVAGLTIEPTAWVLERQRYRKNPEYYSPSDEWVLAVPGDGLTRSRVQLMSWEKWREMAEKDLKGMAVEDLQDRGLELVDIQAVAPRKLGATRRRLTDVEKARTVLRYVVAVARGEKTGKAVAEFLGVGEKRARNLIAELRDEGFLTPTEGKKPGGKITPKTVDLLKQQRATVRTR